MDGEILGAGRFDCNVDDVSYRSAETELLPPGSVGDTSTYLPAIISGAAEENAAPGTNVESLIVETVRKKQAVLRSYDMLFDLCSNMVVALNDAAYTKFKFLAVLAFNKKYQRFSDDLRNFPEGSEKRICEDFSKLAGYTFYMERAALINEKMIEETWRSANKERKMFSYIDEAARHLQA